MSTTKLNKRDLLILKAKIKGLAEEGARCYKFIHDSSGEKRSRYRDIKRSIGREARYHLIAYGLLRGKDYNQIEPNSNKDKMASYLFDYDYLAQICKRYVSFRDIGKWSPDNIRRLIFTGTITITAKVVKREVL